MITNSRKQLHYNHPQVAKRKPPARHAALPDIFPTWNAWLWTMFPEYVKAGFSDHHVEFWDWVWSIELGIRTLPFIALWARRGGKSTSVELATVALGARRRRNYMLYTCETQEQADDHVTSIATLLESKTIEQHYPLMGEKLVSKFGSPKAWRRNRLRTASGFTIDALGLDTAARGIKIDDQRPDGIIVDDIDGEDDSEDVTNKKIRALTRKVLPAGSDDLTVLGAQNLVHEHSIFARLVDGRADFLRDRIVSGPHPALLDFIYDHDTNRIKTEPAEDDDGNWIEHPSRPTWQGQNVEICQNDIYTYGIDAFIAECQHENVGSVGRFLPDMALWDNCKMALENLDRHTPVVMGLDAGESSDTFAIVLVSEHPNAPTGVAVRYAFAYVPEKNQKLDYDAIETNIRMLCRQYAVLAIVYDPMLLGQTIRKLERDRVALCVPFSQGAERLIADKQLLDLIETRKLAHDGTTQLREHIDNANRKGDPEGRKLRIVKRQKSLKIDLAVATSMASARYLSNPPVRVERPANSRQQNRWNQV